MTTTYRVTITRIERGEREVKEYKKLCDTETKERPNIYGYVPVVLPFKDEIDVFNQIVETLDIKEVIRAVNGGAE